jgi:glycosyltransferase involved in cell wall biosynthesis
MSRPPLISILTVNRNRAADLRRTLETTAAQTFRDFEHLVVDGASTDGSPQLLAEFRDHLAFAVSEPDRGIYDAMNKAIARARGRYLLFVNSGDHLKSPDSLRAAARHLEGPDLLYFNLEVVDPSGGARVEAFPATLDFTYFARHSLPHPATFIARELFARHGPYDPALRIVADWKAFLLWVCKHNCSYRHVPEVLSVFTFDGISSRPESTPILHAERTRVLEQEFPAVYRSYLASQETERQLARLRRNPLVRVLRKTGLVRDR